MRIGIAFDLKSDFDGARGAVDGPEDQLEEFDSLTTVEAIAGALREDGHTVELLGGGRKFVERLLAAPPELVFNIAEGRGSRSREAHVPAVCEMLRVPVTHSDPLTLALTLDKALAKKVAAAAGVATPRFAVVEKDGAPVDPRTGRALETALDATIHAVIEAGLVFPMLVKPLFEGSSMGIRRHSRVTDAAGLRREVQRIVTDYAQPALIEEFCSGPEFTIGVRGTGASARVIGVMEIVPRTARLEEFVYSLEVKRDWEAEVEYHVPPRRAAAVVQAVADLAIAAYRALACRDIGRVDVRLDAQGEPRFLEVNPLPGLNPTTGDLCILAARSGVPYAELVRGIVADACLRRAGSP